MRPIRAETAFRVTACGPQHLGLRQVTRTEQARLHLGVALIEPGHVLVDRLGLVELALALEVQGQMAQVVHQ